MFVSIDWCLFIVAMPCWIYALTLRNRLAPIAQAVRAGRVDAQTVDEFVRLCKRATAFSIAATALLVVALIM